MAIPVIPPDARLLAKVLINRDTSCWEWQAFRDEDGYGTFWLDGRNRYAHRASYELFVAPIPDGMTLDHTCRNRPCVNPAHLEPVSIGENLLRSPITAASINQQKTHCDRESHPLSGDNLYVDPRGKRECRTCRRKAVARHTQRNKELV